MKDHNRDLRKMGRRDLLELLIASEEENNRLREQLEQLTVQLQSKKLQIENAGSMAEAAMTLNGVFESADKAAAQYLENIRLCSEQQKSIYDKVVSEAEQKAKEILDSAEKEKQKRINEADAYWQNLSTKLDAVYQDHVGLREMLAVLRKMSEDR